MVNPLRKTMVYLGLADEEYEDDHPHAAPVAPAPTRSQPHAAVTPIRRASSSRNAAPAVSEIVTLHPRAYRDARALAESFREGVPVILNISQMDDADARRLIDFACGLVEGLYGKIEKVTGKVFLLSPEHVAVSGDAGETSSPVDAGFAYA